MIRVVFELLGKSMDIELTNEYVHHPPGIKDLRTSISPKKEADSSQFKSYHQVFEERHGFVADLSIIDLIFNEGPAAIAKLNKEKGN